MVQCPFPPRVTQIGAPASGRHRGRRPRNHLLNDPLVRRTHWPTASPRRSASARTRSSAFATGTTGAVCAARSRSCAPPWRPAIRTRARSQLPPTIALLDRMAGRRGHPPERRRPHQVPPLPPGSQELRHVRLGTPALAGTRPAGPQSASGRPAKSARTPWNAGLQTGTRGAPHRARPNPTHPITAPPTPPPPAYDSRHAGSPPPRRRRPPARRIRPWRAALRGDREGGGEEAPTAETGAARPLPCRAPRRTHARDRTRARGLRAHRHRGARHRHLAGDPRP